MIQTKIRISLFHLIIKTLYPYSIKKILYNLNNNIIIKNISSKTAQEICINLTIKPNRTKTNKTAYLMPLNFKNSL